MDLKTFHLQQAVARLLMTVRNLDVTELQGYTKGSTDFLRADGTFAAAGLNQGQSLIRISFRG